MKRFLGNVRRWLCDVLNTMKAWLDIGDYWYWLESGKGGEGLEIRELVFPLRYDILVRKEFFDFYHKNKEIYKSDYPDFMRRARQHSYYVWFCKVLVERFSPDLRYDKEGMDRAYEKRVVTSVKLYDSIIEKGFDVSHPIIPFTGKVITPADSGRKTGNTYFMGDGCHRLACLISLGYERLPPGYFRIKCFKRLTPLDNTRMLSSSMKIGADWL